ncbi:MAG TPA: aminotransferase class I/II-fold pyridoxal phosphate-dependent enzyme [Acidimicrobiia bacterium]|nr:aminotransferase class I/II-fold pyridoxal phosphate-dependent enzyme [Acidimicrobiia bacterium]
MTVPAAGPHGGDGPAVAAALGVDPASVLDLSVSLNPFAPDVRTLAVGHLDALGRYPDPHRATAPLAAAIGVEAERVVLTNGGSEAIALVAAELGPGWVDEPDFSLYRRHLPAVHSGAPVWRSNPRNPTGELAPPDTTAAVWDEAFYPLAAGTWTRGDAGAVVVGSLTKVFACPGLRLGYVLAPDPRFADRLRARQPRWPVNGLAAALLPELLERADLSGWTAGIARLRAELVAVLRAQGLRPRPSDAPFVLVDGATRLRERLAPLGIVVRDCTSFGLPDCARVAVPDSDGLARLDAALRAVAAEEVPA